MDLQKKYPCGGLIIAGIHGTQMDRDAQALIHEYGIGNFIIFGRNVHDGPQALKKLCLDLKSECAAAGLPPPVIAVDQEGGVVQRMGPPFWDRLPGAGETGASADPADSITDLACKTAHMLRDAGINMNMAPVLDIAGPAEKGVLAERCFGPNSHTVSMAGQWYIKTLQKEKIAAVAKHFPGIGMVREDPHLKRPLVNASRTQLTEQLAPFRQAISDGVSSIMTSHVIFTSLDRECPASFSTAIAHDLLRDELGFKGLLITDDLEMGGITLHGTVPQAALRAFLAGHDMLLICHDTKRIKATVHEMRSACRDGIITGRRLETSLERIERLRMAFC